MKTPEFHVEISSPSSKYRIALILEGKHVDLPFDHSFGNWGDSGKRWAEQHGTPIGADIAYYADFENKYYHLDVDFSVETIKDYMQRAYAQWDDHDVENQELKKLGRGHETSNLGFS